MCAFQTLYSGGNLDFTAAICSGKDGKLLKGISIYSPGMRLRFKQVSPDRCDDHAALPGMLKGVISFVTSVLALIGTV